MAKEGEMEEWVRERNLAVEANSTASKVEAWESGKWDASEARHKARRSHKTGFIFAVLLFFSCKLGCTRTVVGGQLQHTPEAGTLNPLPSSVVNGSEESQPRTKVRNINGSARHGR